MHRVASDSLWPQNPAAWWIILRQFVRKPRARADIERRIVEREALFRAILDIVAQRPEGAPLANKDFAQIGSTPAIGRALAHLVEHGRLMRVGRGLYARPVATRIGLGRTPPSIDHVIQTLARTRGETVVPHGAASAFALGLTREPPAGPIYLTSGRSRRMTVADSAVELRHAPAWQIDIPVRRAGNVIRALAWMGPAKAEAAARRLALRLPEVAAGELEAANRNLPDWLSAAVGRLAEDLRRRYGAVSAPPIRAAG
jgi:hypothetical protein